MVITYCEYLSHVFTLFFDYDGQSRKRWTRGMFYEHRGLIIFKYTTTPGQLILHPLWA